MNQDMSIVQLLLNASWVVQAVVLILMLVSVMSWAAIFRKLLSLKEVKKLNEEFEREFWSGKSRDNNEDEKYLGEDGEWLVQFAKEKLKTEHYNYFIFGHRHLPLYMDVGNDSFYINLGDWISHNTYAVFDGEKLELKKYVG